MNLFKRCKLFAVSLQYRSKNAFAFSYTHGPSPSPLRYQTLPQLFQEITNKHSDRIAVASYHQNLQQTYAQLFQNVQKIASGLVALGFKPGDRLALVAPNCYEWYLIQLATAALGVIIVCINPAYRTNELRFSLKKMNVKGIITYASFKSINYIEMLEEIIPNLNQAKPGHINSSEIPNLQYLFTLNSSQPTLPGFLSFNDLFKAGGSDAISKLEEFQKSLTPEDPINVQFTSGTTGQPKAATLSHHNIINNGELVGNRMLLTEDDKLLLPVPLFHCFGNVLGNLASLSRGASVVYAGESWNVQTTLEAASKYQATCVYGVPLTMSEIIIEHTKSPEKYSIKNMTKGLAGGTSVPPALMERIIKFGITHFVQGYGQTESSPAAFISHPEDPIDIRSIFAGKVLPHTELKIVDEEGRTVPWNSQGEIWIRGYLTMLGYYDDYESTNKTFSHTRWLKTGDLGVMNEQGYLRITGRKKDMIIRGGENIYPREIEDFLVKANDHIQDAQVFGVPDERLDEEICVYIKMKESYKMTKEEVLKLCKGKISHFKIPKYVKFVDQIPMTGSGKAIKFRMRDEMIEVMKDPENLKKYMIR